MDRQSLLKEIESALTQAAGVKEALQATVSILDRRFDYFTWTGFYLVERDELIVGPYVGKPTPHTRIKVGQGACGAAAEAKKTIIVDNVDEDSRYLACSAETRSEIVVPLLDGDRVLGEIDIDSDTPGAFTAEDAAFLEKVAQLVVGALGRLEN